MSSCASQPPEKVQRHVNSNAVKKSNGGSFYFKEMTGVTGVNLAYRNGEETDDYTLLETLGGGGAALDFDGDGLLDIFLTGGGFFTGSDEKQIKSHPCRLYRNLGNWRFADVTDEVGLNIDLPYSHGAAVGDINNDGWPDLLVTGFGRVLLFRNECGHGRGRRFVEISKEAGLENQIAWATSAAFGDLDGDGFADLFVCQYTDWSFANNPKCSGYGQKHDREVCSPKRFNGLPDLLLRNDGCGRFFNVTKEAGILAEGRAEQNGKGLGVVMVDLNDDLAPDIYVGNDTTENLLFMNKSLLGRLEFKEQGRMLGVARDDKGQLNGSMGVDAADIDGRGMPALWATNFESELHALYAAMKVDGRRRFVYGTHRSGVSIIGSNYVGWGTAFVDLDNDSSMDIVIANGHVMRHPPSGNLRQKPVLFRNKGKGTFTNVTGQGGDYFNKKHRGRGLIAGDFDNDGKMDVVISHVNEPVAVLRNVHPNKNHWLGVYLRGKDNRDVVGAKVTLQLKDRVLTRFQKSGGSYLSSSDPRLLFGLGPSSTTGKVIVHWPTGSPRIEHWDGLAVDRYHDLRQGQGKSK